MPRTVVEPEAHSPYRRLFDHLAACESGEECLSFHDLERLVGPLPPGARLHREWWANRPLTPQARAWMYAGWKVAARDLEASRVLFRRVASPHNASVLSTEDDRP